MFLDTPVSVGYLVGANDHEPDLQTSTLPVPAWVVRASLAAWQRGSVLESAMLPLDLSALEELVIYDTLIKRYPGGLWVGYSEDPDTGVLLPYAAVANFIAILKLMADAGPVPKEG